MITTTVRDGVAEILLNAPPFNCITDSLLTELMHTLRRAGNDPQVRAIVLGSAIPRRFCAGLDLPQFLKNTHSDIRTIVNKLYFELYELQSSLPKPVIAAISGAVRGGGMSIAITCDMIVAAEDATFGYPELEVGLLPAIHFTHLPRIVGKPRAFDLLFTGRVFDSQEAMDLGLLTRIVKSSEVLSEAHNLAGLLAGKSPELMRMGKEAFIRATDNNYKQGAANAVDLVSIVFGTIDGKEGLTAFSEKRKPKWQGV